MVDEKLPFGQDDINEFSRNFESTLSASMDNALRGMKFDKVKASIEKSLDFKKSKEKFDKTFGESAEELSNKLSKGLKNAIGKGSDLQNDYYNLVSTKERKRFDKIKKDIDVTTKKLTAQIKTEETKQRNLQKKIMDGKRKMSAFDKKELEDSMKRQKTAIEKITKLKLSKQAELKEAEFKARSSEGKVGFMEAAMKKMGGGGVKKGVAAGAAGIPLLGKLIKGMNVWSLAATGLLTVITSLFNAFIRARRNTTAMAASFRGAGLSASEAQKAVGRLRTGFTDVAASAGISIESFSETVLKRLGEFPDALQEMTDESGKGIQRTVDLAFAMGESGKSITDTIQSVGTVAKEQAVDTKEYTRLYKLARGAANKSIMSFDQSINTLLNMNKALRSVTFDTTETEKMFALMGGTLKSFKGALKVSDDQISEFMMSLSQGIAGMKLPEVAGMFALVNRRMPGPKDLRELTAQGGLFKLQLQAISRVMGGIPDTYEGFGQDIYRLDAAMKQFGINIPFSQLEHFATALIDMREVLGKDAGVEAFRKKGQQAFKDIAIGSDAMKDMMEKGRKTIADQVSPMQKLTTALTNLMSKTVGIPAVAEGLGKLVGAMESMLNPIDTIQKISSEHPVLSKGLAWNPMLMPYTVMYKLFTDKKNLDRNTRENEAATGGK